MASIYQQKINKSGALSRNSRCMWRKGKILGGKEGEQCPLEEDVAYFLTVCLYRGALKSEST